MAVNPEVEGRSYPPTPPYTLSRAKIREFAEAVGATDPTHTDVEAAKAKGYADVVAPPTLLVSVAQQAEAHVILDPDAGIDFSRLVHGEQKFVHYRPAVAGDEVTATSKVDRARSAGGHSMVTVSTDISTIGGEAVCTTTALFVVRGDS